ncbi:tyrosine-type recombinase/integrase [Rhizorhabdus wittichii]|uniref:tyrosine-type recombinase/integrase n=1 Tax=Rhizorhabdus wittichii TaxID=160791 RepID=UPI00178C1EBE|nr:site-specific integrase [Rhizorhabdus wittichii]
MEARKITQTVVDGLSASGRDEFLWDTKLSGFGVKLSAGGKRSYVYQFRLGGRKGTARRITIGEHGNPLNAAKARERAEEYALLVSRGIDPVAVAADERRVAVDLAFPVYAEKFIESCEGAGWHKLVRGTLKNHVIPHLKKKSLPHIRKSDITDVLDRLPSKQAALKRNTFAVLRRLFSWAVGRGDIERSPFEGMEVPPPVAARDRVLTDNEIAVIWEAAAKAGSLFGPIVRLLIATGQRREEVTQMDWSEVKRSEALWRLPKERAKNNVAHVVPLSKLAIGVLDRIARGEKWPRSGAVFMTSGKGPFTAHARGKKRLDKEAGLLAKKPIALWRLHDLRRTMATNFQRLGVRFEVTESALNHVGVSRVGVAAVYQRHDWLSEKIAAFDAWAAHLETVFGKAENAAEMPEE